MPDSGAAVEALRRYQKGGHCGDGIHHLYATVLGGRRLFPASAINVVTTPSHWITDLNVRVDVATQEPPEVSHCGDGIHHLYATVLGGRRLFPASAINMVTTPSHWIMDLNVCVDAVTQEPPEVDLTWLLRRPFSVLPPVTYRDQCQLSPTALSDWLQDQASIPARVGYGARWGVNCTSGSGLPLNWFDSDQQRHIMAHRMDNVPAMIVLAHRSSHRNTVLDTMCLVCGAQPETAPHLWACSA